MRVILIGGKARSGKDTFADFLIDDLEKKERKYVKFKLVNILSIMLLSILAGMEEKRLNHVIY